jgi:hypothetical protein
MSAVLAWEAVQETGVDGAKVAGGGGLQRASVPGGWLVRDAAARGTLVFVPDPTHSWGAPATRGREIDFGEIE